jgi:hypothetical protein
MAKLSFAAQAVLDAFTEDNSLHDWKHNYYNTDALAAALRAVVDQVMPEVVNAVGDEHDDARHDQWVRIRCKFLAITAELEVQFAD